MTAISCNLYLTTEHFFFASTLFFLAIVAKLCTETLPRDVFLWLASFLWVDLLCIRIETGQTLLDKTEESGFGIRGESNWNTWRLERFCVFFVQSP